MNKILISACLLGQPVRYDGTDKRLNHPVLERWRREGRLVPFCPEVAGGLPTPRPPAEIAQRFPVLVSTRDGEDLTPAFLRGAELTLEIAQREHCCCALMKAQSPSCGSSRVHSGRFDDALVEGPGIAAGELLRHGFAVFDETQLDALIAFIEEREANAA